MAEAQYTRHGSSGGEHTQQMLEALEEKLNSGNGSFQNYSRASSLGSVHISSSASSAQNTDDEDSDHAQQDGVSYRERRREAHTEAERKRREAIKKGYDDLQCIVPKCQNPDSLGSTKVSKATILQRAIEYIQYQKEQKKRQEETLETLKKEVTALKIIKANYEHLIKTNQGTSVDGTNQVSDEVKFQVFQQIMDTLFKSFDSNVSVNSFATLSGCILSWLEEHCKPQTLREMTKGILRHVGGIGPL